MVNISIKIWCIKCNEDVNICTEIGNIRANINVIKIQSSLNNGLIFAVGDDMIAKLRKRMSNNVHNRMHPKTCWSSNADSKAYRISHKMMEYFGIDPNSVGGVTSKLRKLRAEKSSARKKRSE